MELQGGAQHGLLQQVIRIGGIPRQAHRITPEIGHAGRDGGDELPFRCGGDCRHWIRPWLWKIQSQRCGSVDVPPESGLSWSIGKQDKYIGFYISSFLGLHLTASCQMLESII